MAAELLLKILGPLLGDLSKKQFISWLNKKSSTYRSIRDDMDKAYDQFFKSTLRNYKNLLKKVEPEALSQLNELNKLLKIEKKGDLDSPQGMEKAMKLAQQEAIFHHLLKQYFLSDEKIVKLMTEAKTKIKGFGSVFHEQLAHYKTKTVNRKLLMHEKGIVIKWLKTNYPKLEDAVIKQGFVMIDEMQRFGNIDAKLDEQMHKLKTLYIPLRKEFHQVFFKQVDIFLKKIINRISS